MPARKRYAIGLIAILFFALGATTYAQDTEEPSVDAATKAAEERAAAAARAAEEARAAKEKAEQEALQIQIKSRAEAINKLESEINKYQNELRSVSSQKQTLTSTIKQLDLSKKRAEANIAVTKEKIADTEDKIQTLSTQLGTRTEALKRMTAATAETIRALSTHEDSSFVENFLQEGTLSSALDKIKNIRDVQESVQQRVNKLRDERKAITTLKSASEYEKNSLTKEQQNFISHKQSLEIAKQTKSQILAETKNQESYFQKILEDKKKAKQEFEAQMRDYESQLKYVLDKSKLPTAGASVLSWPLDHIRINQKFGSTAFAKGGAYGGKGHNGVDFQASIGTPVKAALTGTIVATGNSDLYRGCYSYGKWVLALTGRRHKRLPDSSSICRLYRDILQVGLN
jgi:murein DD-endopeptidase MepM/ murein hydrolase activator NlpD